MRTMKWVCVVGLALAALLATGCATGHMKGVVPRGIVQVQRHDDVGGTKVVAYVVNFPGTPETQVWLSSEPVDGLRVPRDNSVTYVPDLDHTCFDSITFRTHMDAQHRAWMDGQRVTQYYSTEGPCPY